MSSCLGVLALALACSTGDSSAERKAVEAAAQQARDIEAAEQRAQEDEAKRRVEARKLEEEREEREYQDAKGALEAFAKVPKKHPKGFGTACDAMLVEYDGFMQKTLDPEAVEKWRAGSEDRIRVMRRKCHERSVEVVVCETQILRKGPPDAEFGHIMRVCRDKFG